MVLINLTFIISQSYEIQRIYEGVGGSVNEMIFSIKMGGWMDHWYLLYF